MDWVWGGVFPALGFGGPLAAGPGLHGDHGSVRSVEVQIMKLLSLLAVASLLTLLPAMNAAGDLVCYEAWPPAAS